MVMKNIKYAYVNVRVFMAAALLFAAGCKTTQKTAETVPSDIPPEDLVSYTEDIRPLMVRSCTPCHFPDKGRKKYLDTYKATRNNIKDIIARCELPVDHPDYMPFKSKKPALTTDEIATMKKWMEQGMPE
jgi:uncharacterized lipoprotein YajG